MLIFSVTGHAEDLRLKRDVERHLVNPLIGLFMAQQDKSAGRHAPSAIAQKSVNQLKQKLGGNWLVEWNKQGTALKSMVRDTQNKSSNSPSSSNKKLTPDKIKKDIAINFLKTNFSLFQIPPDLDDLTVEEVRDYGSGGTAYCCVVPFVQTFNSIPVTNKYVMVTVNENGIIDGVFNHYQPNINIFTTPLLSKADVIDIVQEDALQKLQKILNKNGRSFPIFTEKQKKIFAEKSELTLIVHVNSKQQPVLAYEFYLHTADDSVNIKYLIDANSGIIIEAGDFSNPNTEMNYLN